MRSLGVDVLKAERLGARGHSNSCHRRAKLFSNKCESKMIFTTKLYFICNIIEHHITRTGFDVPKFWNAFPWITSCSMNKLIDL
jgi:hypothetical protein